MQNRGGLSLIPAFLFNLFSDSPSLAARVRACLPRVADRRSRVVPRAPSVVWCVARSLSPRVPRSLRVSAAVKSFLSLPRAWMASSFVGRGAARASHPPDRLAVFYKLVDKQVIAGVLCRYARDAELSASAAVLAEALFGENSLVVAQLRVGESDALTSLACRASGAERDTLFRRSWAALFSVVPLLLRRIEANTLLPGTVQEEEVDYYAYTQAAAKKAMNKPLLPPAVQRDAARAMGYNTLLNAIFTSLSLLPGPLFPAAQKRMVESFVL